MLPLLRAVQSTPLRRVSRVFVIAETDTTSRPRATAAGVRVSRKCLDHRADKLPNSCLAGQALSDTDVMEVMPRSREVGQSFATSVISTVRATWVALAMVLRHAPELILVNGPGTCVPVVLAAWVWRVTGFCEPRVVFVESACRVKTLSLTGRLMWWGLADRVLVQWPDLAVRYPGTEYVGLTV